MDKPGQLSLGQPLFLAVVMLSLHAGFDGSALLPLLRETMPVLFADLFPAAFHADSWAHCSAGLFPLLFFCGTSKNDLSRDLFSRCFFLNPIPAAITTIDEGIVVDANDAYLRLTGYRKEDLVGKAVTAVDIWVEPDSRAALMAELREKGFVQNREIPIRHTSGKIHDCLFFAEIVEYADRPHVLSMAIDITERKLAEQALLEAEGRCRSIMEYSLNGVVVYRGRGEGEDFEFVDFNRAAERIDHITREEVVGKTLLQLFPGMREGALFEALRRVWRTGVPEFLPIVRYEDKRIAGWRENFVYKLPSGEIVSVFSDQTAHKRAEDDLKEQQRKLLTLFGNLPGMVYRCRNDSEWTMEFVSEGCLALTGYTAEELIENRRVSYGQVIHPDERDRVWNEVQKGLGTKEHFQIVYRIITEKGEEKWVWEQGIGVFSPNGELLSMEGFIFDISEHKHIQEELKTSEEKYSAIFQASPDWISVSTFDEGTYIESNEAFLKGTGYTLEEVLGRTSLELGFWEKPEDRKRVIGKIRDKGSIRNEEVRFRTKDGRIRTHLWSAEVMDLGGRACILGWGRDITRYKYIEAEMQRSQRMESLGRLAGSIAHDINNLLAAIDGFCDLIMLKVENRESVAGYVGKIKDVKNSASAFIRQLVSFSRKQPFMPGEVDLNEVIRKMQDLLLPVMGARIDLTLKLDPQACLVKADKSQLEQVVMNLSLNARDAMPRGGMFTLATSHVDLDEEAAARYVGLPPGNYVRIIAADTGNGMDEETAAHVFEPFFTTKEEGKGSGLGLTTVYTIIKQTGGTIRLRTEPGKGATFTIFLPALKGEGGDRQPPGNTG